MLVAEVFKYVIVPYPIRLIWLYVNVNLYFTKRLEQKTPPASTKKSVQS